MVSTAMPRIVASLGGMELYSWVLTAYIIAATVFMPIFGKLSDRFGRRPRILIGNFPFTLAALLSAAQGLGK